MLAKDRSALKAFWSDVSEKSPIPVIIYNCMSSPVYYYLVSFRFSQYFEDPGATGGIDLDSELIVELAKDCPNLAGVKLTCVIFFNHHLLTSCASSVFVSRRNV